MAAAAEAAKRAAVGLHPPSSAFAELLRNSRFASFDPLVRQTYYSPPENLHRGDWGLKRPITLRRKNAHITLKDYEHRAFFVEWSRGDPQVNFIKKFDAANITPTVGEGESGVWGARLGKHKSYWMIDSDYCPEEDESDLPVFKSEPEPEPEYDHELAEAEVNEMLALGESGPGMYGADPKEKEEWEGEDYIQPNIYAMSPQQFHHYIKKLRTLRPQFMEWLKKHAEVNPHLVGKRVTDLHNDALTLHRQFLAEYWKKEFTNSVSRKVEQQPHAYAGLTYARMSILDGDFTRKFEPGLVLQEIPFATEKPSEKEKEEEEGEKELPAHIVSYAGVSALLNSGELPEHIEPLVKKDADTIDPKNVEKASMSMAFMPGTFMLYQAPNVVGRFAQGLKGVRVTAEVVVDPEEEVREADVWYSQLSEEVKSDLAALVAEQTEAGQTQEIEEFKSELTHALGTVLEDREAAIQEVIEEANSMDKQGDNYLNDADKDYVDYEEMEREDDEDAEDHEDHEEHKEHKDIKAASKAGRQNVLNNLKKMMGEGGGDSAGPYGL
ncbi:mitochondrial ribosomal protein subunit-domain-containing protein [Cyathus striatus]|nr:mitochondrial ribosomal protein subunit-domain-containing protein [Cyathus striatus]